MLEKRKKLGGTTAAVFLAVLLLGYPLSSGPALVIYEATGRNPTVCRVLGSVYDPLAKVPEPFNAPIKWWWKLWDGLVGY